MIHTSSKPTDLLQIGVICYFLAAFFSPIAAEQTPAPWWNDDWKYRKTIVIPQEGQRWPDSYACKVRFTTGGNIQPEGEDVRVVNSNGNLVKHKTIFPGPDDFCLIAFDVQDKSDTFYVYYRNPAAESIPQWDLKLGLTLETREKGEGSCHNWRQMKQLISNSRKIYNKDYWERIFDGFNPFGPSDNYVSIYEGYLWCHESGDYRFATVSDDASFLFIDGELVVSWPGWHGVGGGARAQHNGGVTLTRGYHKLEYYHVDRDSEQCCVAAWKRPGHDRYEVIPPWAFPGLLNGEVVSTEKRGSPLAADFTFATESDLEIKDAKMTMIAFKNTSFCRGSSIDSYLWDFGDGTTSKEQSPAHVYLDRGAYKVKLTARSTDGEGDTVEQRVTATRKWSQWGYGERSAENYYRIIRNYPFRRLSTAALRTATTFLESRSKKPDLLKVCLILNKRSGEVSSEERYKNSMLLGDLHRDELKDYDKAMNFYRDAFNTASGQISIRGKRTIGTVKEQVEARFRIADTLFYYKRDYDRAIESYHSIMRDFPEVGTTLRAPELRIAQIRIGDVYKERGMYNEALAEYQKAEDDANFKKDYPPMIKKGAYGQTVENYIKRRELDAALKELDNWEWDYPTERLSGYSCILRARCNFLKKNYDEAIKQAENFIAVGKSTKSNYLPEVYMLLGDCLTELGNPQAALKNYEIIVNDYPESPLRSTAKDKASSVRLKIRGAESDLK